MALAVRTRRTPGRPFIAVSMGKVTFCSTSSAANPGASPITTTVGDRFCFRYGQQRNRSSGRIGFEADGEFRWDWLECCSIALRRNDERRRAVAQPWKIRLKAQPSEANELRI